jgi:DNA-binding SARP family transcriptional activator/tetratricopeptide (TPR) repeat protein
VTQPAASADVGNAHVEPSPLAAGGADAAVGEDGRLREVVTRLPAGLTARDGAVLDIRLLGDVQVRVDGERLEMLRPGRALSLLAFLVLHPRVAHARQQLAFQFWPDSPEAQARTNLRNVLHTLRRMHPALQSALRVTSDTLEWDPPLATTVDVEQFVTAAGAAAGADPDDADDLIARCRDALALYGGDLVPGDDDDWMVRRREALRDQYRGVLRLLATALIDAGRPGEATGVARELVHADPLDEVGHRLRIEAHHAAGDRAGAVRAYHECSATLERELGVEPAPATVAAYAAVLDRQPEPAATARSPLAGFVGREQEWKRLLAAWEDAAHRPPAVVLVTGEPGVGKTRLVEELRTVVAKSGATVAEGRSYESERDVGYGLVTAWLRSPGVEVGLRSLDREQRSELARLMPELGSPPRRESTDDSDRRRRLFDASARALTGTGKPTLLVADDCQWSDRPSQEFIHYLVRQRSDVPLLVVLTARAEELDLDHPVAVLRDALIVLDRLTELPLGRLSLEATGDLGSQLNGTPLDEAARRALFADTEGNPLFIVETLRAGWDGVQPGALTPRLRAVVDARFRRLSAVASTVLGAAAVVNRPASAELLARICDIDDRSLARGLDELWRRGILREAGVDGYEFTHGKLADAAYENLSPVMRRSYHGAVAEALSELVGREPDIASSHVAVHFEAAGRTEEAVAWFQRAALDAQAVAAYEEAVRLLDRALALVPALPSALRHLRELELLSSVPSALGGAEGFGTHRMREAHQRAEAAAARLGVDLEPAVLRSMVMSALCRDEFVEAEEAAERLLARATELGDDSAAFESRYLLGISAFWAADLDRARERFEAVVAGFDGETRVRHQQTYGHDPQVVCLSRLANTLWFLGRPDDARQACEDALALADEVHHPLSHDTAAIFGCLLAIDLEDPELLRRLEPRLSALGMRSLPFLIKREAVAGLVHVLDGRHEEGISRTRSALERCQGHNFYPGYQAAIGRILVAAHQHGGDAEGGLEACARVLAIGGTPLWSAEIHRARAEFLHATGGDAEWVDEELRIAAATAIHQGADGHRHRIEATRRRLVTATTST